MKEINSTLINKTRDRVAAYLETFIDNEVLIFDITVGDTLAVQVIHGLDNLAEDVTSLIFREMFVLGLFDTFKQIVRRPAGELRTYSGVCGTTCGLEQVLLLFFRFVRSVVYLLDAGLIVQYRWWRWSRRFGNSDRICGDRGRQRGRSRRAGGWRVRSKRRRRLYAVPDRLWPW